jgi:hypothetical protein
MALKAAGHSVFWLELMQSTGSHEADLRTVRHFYDLLRRYELSDNWAVLVFQQSLDSQPFEDAEVLGASTGRVRRSIADADLLLNFACAVRQPLLSLFKRRALLDGDPGHLQVAQSIVDLDLDHHEAFLTVGARINASGSLIPKLGHEWRTFEQLIYLPLWKTAPGPERDSPFTSMRQLQRSMRTISTINAARARLLRVVLTGARRSKQFYRPLRDCQGAARPP